MWPLYWGMCCGKLGPAILRSSPGGVDTCSLCRYASERCLLVCELGSGQGPRSVLAVQLQQHTGLGSRWSVPGCRDAVGVSSSVRCRGASPWIRDRALCCCSPALWRCLCSAGSSLSPCLSPLVLLSQTCHLVPSGAGTPVGHFLSPVSSEFIPASPSLIFLHCLHLSGALWEPWPAPATACHQGLPLSLPCACRRLPQASSCPALHSFPCWPCTACPQPGTLL